MGSGHGYIMNGFRINVITYESIQIVNTGIHCELMGFIMALWTPRPKKTGGVSNHPSRCRPESVRCHRRGSCYWRQIQRSAPPLEWRSCPSRGQRRDSTNEQGRTMAEHGRTLELTLRQSKCKQFIFWPSTWDLNSEIGWHNLTHITFLDLSRLVSRLLNDLNVFQQKMPN